MEGRTFPKVVCGSLLVLLLLVAGHIFAKDKKTACSNAHPEQLCTAENTCGANGTKCVLEVKRAGGGNDADVVPNVPNYKKNSAICIATGASVTWQGGGKNTGIMVDFGSNNPFDPSGPIMGGSDRPITVVAKKAGCFHYSAGACTAGTAYGMCGNSDFDLIVTSGSK